MTDDLILLRQYEPILRYTYGEHFFPLDIERYIRHSALWVLPRRAPAVELIPRGELSPDDLSQLRSRDEPGLYFLQFVKPLTGRALRRFVTLKDRPRFRARGRLARVGLTARIADALFTVTLLLRGTVPGGTEAAAEQAYREMMAANERYTYYGRVIRQDGYIILHYLYFYCMNDWRSSFHGVNDHEGDWEQIFVYLEDNDDQPQRPIWVAYASHDYHGDDLRRRWDDPELQKIGTHPLVFVGAGSHASYYQKGEYLVTVRLSMFRTVIRVVDVIQRFWQITLRQGDPDNPPGDIADLFRIPFVDYARGDGIVIGPGGDKNWTPLLLDPVPGWLEEYRGLWGFYAKDPVSGENAPAGPKFNRDGTIRRSWHNPLGWSGLQKVKPPGSMTETLQAQIADLLAAQQRDRAAAAEQQEQLTQLYIQRCAIADEPHLKEPYRHAWASVQEAEERLNSLHDGIATRGDIIQACEEQLARIQAGDIGPARAHIEHAHTPQSEADIHLSTLAESWAAFSVGLLLVGFVLLILTAEHWIIGVGLLVGAFVLIEAVFRREIDMMVVRFTMALSVIITLILIYDFFWEIVIAGLMAVGIMILRDNLRELRE
jgi:hypothetical protein